ncbi:hypothetical protein SNEBB_006497 [Seison nebaliae]|nr:hypothetical protein SNEBB_006497 [Seison nebaliae]
MATHKILPLELVEKCVGNDIYVILKGNREIYGKLCGFDDFVNLVLEDVTDLETTDDGKRRTKLDTILLSGINILMLVPGGQLPEEYSSSTTTTT